MAVFFGKSDNGLSVELLAPRRFDSGSSDSLSSLASCWRDLVSFGDAGVSSHSSDPDDDLDLDSESSFLCRRPLVFEG